MATSPWYYIASCVSLLGRVSACGSPMTYSLFEFAKEHAEELVVVTETPAVPEQGPNTGKLCYRINMHDVWTPWIFTFMPRVDLSIWGFSSRPSKPPFTYSHTMDGQLHVVWVYLHVHIHLCLMQLNKTGSAAPNWRTQIIPPKFTTTIIHAHLVLQSQKNFLHPRDVKYTKL